MSRKERINPEGKVVEFEKPKYFRNLYQASIEYTLDLSTTKDKEFFDLVREFKITKFEKESYMIKLWETPLQKASLVYLLELITSKLSIELVLTDNEEIAKRETGSLNYNANLCMPLRKVSRMLSIVFHFGEADRPVNEFFETKFTESLLVVTKNMEYFGSIAFDDVIIYSTDIVENDGVQYVKTLVCKINQVETGDDYNKFKSIILPRLKLKFFSTISASCVRRTPYFFLNPKFLDTPDIKYMGKKREKLQKIEDWSYYLPADWICYPFMEGAIPTWISANWIPMYHPIGGFDFSLVENLNMCDDCGPNKFSKELTNFPLDQGIFVTPRIKYILGFNSTGTIHTKPIHIKDELGNDYYFLIVLQCYVNPARIRVPSVFSRSQYSKRSRP